MDSTSILLGASNIFVGLLILAVVWPLRQGKVPRNSGYGFRTRAALSLDEAWVRINRFGARQATRWCVVLVLIGIFAFFVPIGPNAALTIVFALAPLIVIIPCIETIRYGRRTTPPRTSR